MREEARGLEPGPGASAEHHDVTVAGVSKETLHRWWSSKAEVVIEAIAEYIERTIPLPNAGSLASDLGEFSR
jgi:hypothetical protein